MSFTRSFIPLALILSVCGTSLSYSVGPRDDAEQHRSGWNWRFWRSSNVRTPSQPPTEEMRDVHHALAHMDAHDTAVEAFSARLMVDSNFRNRKKLVGALGGIGFGSGLGWLAVKSTAPAATVLGLGITAGVAGGACVAYCVGNYFSFDAEEVFHNAARRMYHMWTSGREAGEDAEERRQEAREDVEMQLQAVADANSSGVTIATGGGTPGAGGAITSPFAHNHSRSPSVVGHHSVSPPGFHRASSMAHLPVHSTGRGADPDDREEESRGRFDGDGSP